MPFVPFVPFVPSVPLVTVNDVPSAQWMVAVPSWLSVSEQEVPSLPAAPLLPEQPPASAAATARTKEIDCNLSVVFIVHLLMAASAC